MGEERKEVRSGDVIFLPSDVPHGFFNTTDKQAIVMLVGASVKLTINTRYSGVQSMDASKFKGMKFYTDEETREITDELEKAITIPVNAEIEAEHRVYDMSEMREILLDADRIGLQDCGCKQPTTTVMPPRMCASA